MSSKWLCSSDSLALCGLEIRFDRPWSERCNRGVLIFVAEALPSSYPTATLTGYRATCCDPERGVDGTERGVFEPARAGLCLIIGSSSG